MPFVEFMREYIDPEMLRITIPSKTQSRRQEEENKDQKEEKDRGRQRDPITADSSTADDTITYTIDVHCPATISQEDFEACFKLIEITSSADYRNSSIGWSPRKKKDEMRLPPMRYLLLRPPHQEKRDGMPIAGFLSFMVTYEDNRQVLYCYEIHLLPTHQGRGLGQKLMAIFEEIGCRIGLEKGMLTVFRSNQPAIRFYSRLGFGVDEYSPTPRVMRNGTIKEPDYLILSKDFLTR